MTTVPLVDLAVQHAQIADEVEEGFAEVLAAGDFIGGKAVAAFEQEYAEFVGARHCVGVANGTDALEIALRAVGVGAGDEVVVPANTFIATAEAVVRAGARPVFADVDDEALLLDPAAVEAVLTDRTRAVIPVDLYGQVAPFELLTSVGERGIAVVEDGAQSQGASRLEPGAGRSARIAATSFYPGKNLGAYGDAGAVTTDDDRPRRGGEASRRARQPCEVPARQLRFQLAARHPPGRRAPGEAAQVAAVERPEARSGRGLRRAPRARPRRRVCPPPSPATSTSGTSTSSGYRTARRCCAPCRRSRSVRASTTPSRCT